MPTKKYIIAADIETTSHLHIGAINKGTYMMSEGSAPYILRYTSKDKSGPQCALTRTVQLFTNNGGTDGGSGTSRVPVIPASTVAGKLRRAAADLLFNSMLNRDLQVSPDVYNTMTTGTPSTDISTSTSIPEVVRAARNDPFLNLFGGTPFMISSASVIAEGWPLLEATRGLMMTEPILTPMTLTKLEDMSEAVAIVRKNDVLDMTGKNLEKVISLSDLAQYFSKESDDRKASKQRRDEGETGTKTSLRSLNAFEAVLPGIAFSLRIELTSRSPSHLGMMLLAVQSFLRDGQVGGKAARGFGRFALAPNASRLYEVDPEQRNKLVLSSIFGDKSSGYEFVKSPVIVEAVDAAQDYIDDCNPGLYEAFTSANAHGIKAMQKAVAVA